MLEATEELESWKAIEVGWTILWAWGEKLHVLVNKNASNRSIMVIKLLLLLQHLWRSQVCLWYEFPDNKITKLRSWDNQANIILNNTCILLALWDDFVGVINCWLDNGASRSMSLYEVTDDLVLFLILLLVENATPVELIFDHISLNLFWLVVLCDRHAYLTVKMATTENEFTPV